MQQEQHKKSGSSLIKRTHDFLPVMEQARGSAGEALRQEPAPSPWEQHSLTGRVTGPALLNPACP